MNNATKFVQWIAVVGARFKRRGIAQACGSARRAAAEIDASGERLRRAKNSVSSNLRRLVVTVKLAVDRAAEFVRIDSATGYGAPRARDVVVGATTENEIAEAKRCARWRLFCLTALVALHAGCAAAALNLPTDNASSIATSSDLVSAANIAHEQSYLDEPSRGELRKAEPLHEEPFNSGWAFYIDNDAFAPRPTDRDYTGGFSLTMAGRRAANGWWSLDGLRAAIDHLFRLDNLYADRGLSRHSEEVGVTVFTPGELSDTTKQVGDRPYASLIYVANTAAEIAPERDTAYLSTFTLGVLGAPIVGDAQRALHRATGSAEPKGWENQISAGGEPTLRYAFARVGRVWHGTLGNSQGELTTTWRGSVGYLTDASFGVATRIGEIRTPWWSYNPQIAEYAEKSVPVVASEGGGGEHYLWAGFNVRARVYNAFLEGQFRHSDVTFSADQLNPLILEGWIGYTWAFRSGWRMSYVLRGQSSEIRSGPADRTETWGGIIVSYAPSR